MQDVTIPALSLLAVLGAASLVVLALAGVRLQQRGSVISPVSTTLPQFPWLPLVLGLTWVGVQVLSITSTPSGKVPTLEDVQAMCLFSILLLLFLVIPLVIHARDDMESPGFHLQLHDWPKQLSLGILGFFACVIPVIAAWSTTLPWRTPTNQHGLLQLLEQDGSLVSLFWIVLAAVVLAPLLEELVYRVILQTWLQRIAPPREALIAVAVIFAAVHRLPDAVPLLPLALILGYLYQQTRSFLTVVVTHMLFNATNLTLALM